MEKHLHIVCLDVPYPVDYGGVFDLFYKITALADAGIAIHLHCFEYGRGHQPELEKYCVEVNYYPRQQGHKGFSHNIPYIVCSRSSPELMDKLLSDQYPILLEGVHCSYLLRDERFRERKIFLRLHNIEYKYYRQLYHSEKGLFKKLYYWNESHLLKRYEKGIANRAFIISVSKKDAQSYRREFNASRVEYLPVFLPFRKINPLAGNGCYCLYHGNLSVAENELAATWLLEKVFKGLHTPLVIAGKNPSARLQRLAHDHPDTCLVSNPSEQEMQDMIAKAQINIVPSFNETGVKLKLLNALFNGRHCMINQQDTEDGELQSLCHTFRDAAECREKVRSLYETPFTRHDTALRENILSDQFDSHRQAGRLIEWIW